AIVVDGSATARRALGRLAGGDTGALLLVANEQSDTPTAPSPVPGTRRLADCVRSSVPGVAAAAARLLDGALLAEGDWSNALDLVLGDPTLTVVTRAGDRFGGRTSWRLGGDTLAASRAALDDAERHAAEAAAGAEAASASLLATRAEIDRSRREEADPAEAERRA